MLVIEGFKRRLAGRCTTMVLYPPEGTTMDIHDFFERLLAAYAAYAGGVCGASAD